MCIFFVNHGIFAVWIVYQMKYSNYFLLTSPTFKKENAIQKNDAFIKSSKEFEVNGKILKETYRPESKVANSPDKSLAFDPVMKILVFNNLKELIAFSKF